MISAPLMESFFAGLDALVLASANRKQHEVLGCRKSLSTEVRQMITKRTLSL